MKLYLAARYARRWEMMARTQELEKEGHVVTARWVKDGHDKRDAMQDTYAREDLEDILAAEAIICFTDDPEARPTTGGSSGGRHVELGIALGINAMIDAWEPRRPLRILVVGWKQNVFHYLPNVEYFDIFPKAKAALK